MKYPPTLLIDGDIILYKAASAANREFSFDGDNYITTGSLEDAKVIVQDTLATLLKAFKTEQYVLALTDVTNWRHRVFPAYKSNRKGKARPVCLKPIQKHIAEHYPTYMRPTLEADDILGILATSRQIIKNPGEKIIVSADKDMKTIPGLFYDMNAKLVFEISETEADRWHMFQTLVGDTADGYPGCPKVGAVKAERILAQGESLQTWWPLVVAAFERAGLTIDDALTQARVARICRVTDYDFTNKEVRLWHPPLA